MAIGATERNAHLQADFNLQLFTQDSEMRKNGS